MSIAASPAASSTAEIESPRPTYDPVRPAAEYLALDEPPPRRARLAWWGHLFASEPQADSRPINDRDERTEAAPHDPVMKVVEERPGSVRLLIDASGVRLVSYVRTDDLHLVVRERARVSLDAHSEPVNDGPDGVWLRPGVIVSDRRSGDRRAAVVVDDAHRGEVWVDRGAVSRVYVPDDPAPARASIQIEPGSTITTERGAPLYRVPSEPLSFEIVAQEGGRARVRYLGAALVIEGWVEESALGPPEGPLSSFGTGGGFGWGSSGPKRYLHEGDRLYADPSGEAIGVVTEMRVMAHEGILEEGWRSVGVHVSGWHSSDLSISADDASFGEQWEAVYRQRARLEPAKPGAKLPSGVRVKDDAVRRCWTTALEAGGHPGLTLRLTWKGGPSVAVPTASGLDPALHACLTKAFASIPLPSPVPPPPVSFAIALTPLPLPSR